MQVKMEGKSARISALTHTLGINMGKGKILRCLGTGLRQKGRKKKDHLAHRADGGVDVIFQERDLLTKKGG